jgi:4-diphosphocytidyl-2-C-methyl-D-erythritol kinase
VKNKTICVLANAKLNLNLEVLDRRKDGYHNLSSIFQSVTLSDSVSVSACDGEGVSVVIKNADITGENLAKSAAELFLKSTNQTAKINIVIDKRIPLSAGLGGGSADAAAVLVCLNKLFDEPLSITELESLGLQLGADVPFCISGGTKLVGGIGEKFYPCPQVPNLLVVLIKHHNKSSTKNMYDLLDLRKAIPASNTDAIIKHMQNDEFEKAAKLFQNSFLDVSQDGDEQKEICKYLLDKGALAAGLSGSGPTIYGLFDFYDGDLLNVLKNKYKEVYLCETAETSIETE